MKRDPYIFRRLIFSEDVNDKGRGRIWDGLFS